MKIAILEALAEQKSATAVRGQAMADWLARAGHAVVTVTPPPAFRERFARKRLSLTTRLKRRLLARETLPHLWDAMADALRPRLRRERLDVVIGRSPDVAYLFTQRVASLQIYDLANIAYLEQYHTWGPSYPEVEQTYQKETELLCAADYVLSPHELLTSYLAGAFPEVPGIARKVLTVRLGCDPARRTAVFNPSPRIVYAGSCHYIQDPLLLSRLTGISHAPIDCYGSRDPNLKFFPQRLNYRGFAPTMDFLADYQIGLITVSCDHLRQYSPATKFAYYFAHGLPVLFPEWMKEGHEYEGCALPYSEAGFNERVALLGDRPVWERMSACAIQTARTLEWPVVLRPLVELLAERAGQSA